jgi:hypothetical protein
MSTIHKLSATYLTLCVPFRSVSLFRWSTQLSFEDRRGRCWGKREWGVTQSCRSVRCGLGCRRRGGWRRGHSFGSDIKTLALHRNCRRWLLDGSSHWYRDWERICSHLYTLVEQQIGGSRLVDAPADTNRLLLRVGTNSASEHRPEASNVNKTVQITRNPTN